MNRNNGVKWRKKVEQINDYFKSNNIKIGVDDKPKNDSEMCVR